jgi:HK97 family phage prohead protease
MPATYAPTDADDGVFEAIVSVFNNKDLGGDIVRPGAFADSIAHWKASGDPIPVYWSHRMDDPNYNIGAVTDAQELVGGDKSVPDWANAWVRDNGGLYIKGQLDPTGVAAQVRHLMKNRRVKQFSFSYDVIEERANKAAGENELLKLWLHEVGPTPLGMNPLTELISAKSNPDPPPDDPDPDPDPTPKRRLPSALFLRHQAELARWCAELAD